MSDTTLDEYFKQIEECRFVSPGMFGGTCSSADLEGQLKIFGSLPEEARGNKEFVPKVLGLLSAGGLSRSELVGWFESLPQKIRNDKDAVMAMVTTQGDLLQHASEALKGDKEVVMLAVGHKGSYGSSVLCHVSEALRDDKEVVMKALLSGLTGDQPVQDFEFASERLRGNKDIVLELAALKGGFSGRDPGNPIAFKFATEALKNDKELVMKLVKFNSEALVYASDATQKDVEVVTAANPEWMCLPGGDRPVPGLYDASWAQGQGSGSYNQEVEVGDSGKFKFSYDCEANMVPHQLQGEKWDSFPSPIINISKYKEAYAEHPATIFKLQRISGPFVYWGEDDSNSTIRWTYRVPEKTEKTSDEAKSGYSS